MSDDDTIRAAVYGRVSADGFDPKRPLSEAEIRVLIRDATQAPSSFNIQHWRFVAVRRPADKRKLRELAHDQAVVSQAAVTFIVLGDVEAHYQLLEILEPSVRCGIVGERTALKWVDQARAFYRDSGMARDEAIRSASLAAMVLMISAESRGLASSPLIGFDAPAVCHEFRVPEHCVPVMLLAVGYPAPGRHGARKPRLPVERVLSFDRFGMP